MQLLLALATGAAALVAPTQRALPKTVRHFNFGDFGKSKDYSVGPGENPVVRQYANGGDGQVRSSARSARRN